MALKQIMGKLAAGASKLLGNTFVKELLSISAGIGAGAISTVANVIKGAARDVMKFHEEGIATARDMGLSLGQAQAYTKALVTNTKELAFQYGVTSDTIIKIQKGLSEATNRQLFLNKSQTEHFVQLNKLAGEASISKFADEMMNGMGAQIDTVEGAIAKAYATATKSGLSAKKTTEMIANSLNIANKLSFRNGVDGLTKMAIQAQKVGLSLQSVEGVAKTFMDFEGAIEHAAQLQMLGGAAGAFGGNPLDMMYEANYDPEALQDRMLKMLGGYAQFDAKSGMSRINGMGMDFIRNIAKAMGMDEGEAVKVAKKNAELRFKENRFGGRFKNYSQEEQDYIMNRSYVRDGKLYINDAGGKEHEITNGNLDKDILEELHKWDGKSDREIMEIQAKSLTTINEKIEALIETIKAIIGEEFVKFVPAIQNWIEKNGTKLVNNVADFVKDIPKRWEKIKETVVNIYNGAKKAWGLIAKYFPLFLAMLAANSISGKFGLGKGKGAKPKGGAPNGGKGGAKPNTSTVKKTIGKDGKTYYSQNGKRITADAAKAAKENGAITKTIGKDGKTYYSQNGKRITADAAKAATKNASGTATKTATKSATKIGTKGLTKIGTTIAKGANIAGWVGLAGDMALDAFTPEEDKGSWWHVGGKGLAGAAEWGGLGATLGTMVGGPVGTAVGGILGGIGGAIYGIYDALDSAKGKVEEETKKAKSGGAKPQQSLAVGGPVIGSSIGKAVNIEAHAGEYVMKQEHVRKFGAFLDNPWLFAQPIGNNDFKLKPGKEEVSRVGDNTVTVKDFNINLNGTLKLDGGNSSANLDIRQLLNNPTFVGQLTEMIRDSISSSYNGGRKMFDFAVMRGLPAQTTTWGRR